MTSILLIASIFGVGQYLYEWLIKTDINRHSQIERFVNKKNCNNCHQNGVSIADKKPTKHNWPFTTINVISYFRMKQLNARFNNENAKRNNLYQGEKLARQYMCFNCHGLYGQGGLDNKGSLKGYIPGWVGQDFAHLTDNGNPQAIKQWIRYGVYKKILESPITGYFAKKVFKRQEINMIALPEIPEYEVDTLTDYVIYINGLGELTMENQLRYQYEVRDRIEISEKNTESQ